MKFAAAIYRPLPQSPLYGLFSHPRARLYKVCSHPCMYAPGFIVPIRAKWPRGA